MFDFPNVIDKSLVIKIKCTSLFSYVDDCSFSLMYILVNAVLHDNNSYFGISAQIEAPDFNFQSPNHRNLQGHSCSKC